MQPAPTSISRRPCRDSERGSALVVALMIVLALTALGLVGLRQTSFELRTSANARFSAQAYQVSNAALLSFTDRVGSNAQAYWSYLSNLSNFRLEQAEANTEEPPVDPYRYVVTKDDLYTASDVFFMASDACVFNDTDGDGILDGSNLFDSTCVGFMTEQNSQINFVTTISEPRDGPRAPGFSNNFCFKRFTFRSCGYVSAPGLAVDPCASLVDPTVAPPVLPLDPENPTSVATRQHVAYALVGPIDCSGGYYN
ncbi:MAG: pilus assembly PilX N-terminal domain-containing protein [Myxococcota bacterium]